MIKEKYPVVNGVNISLVVDMVWDLLSKHDIDMQTNRNRKRSRMVNELCEEVCRRLGDIVETKGGF